MIGKTNSKQGAPAAQETVNIRLISNQSEHSDLVGTKFTLSYGTFKKEYTWGGNEVSAHIPAHVTYSVEFGDAEGYNTPEPIIYEAVEDNARTIEAIYTCELLTVNVGADEGTPEGYEVAIYKGSKIDLPSGYTFLEYIESTGAQYIDTGFKPNSNSGIEFHAYNNNESSSGWTYGAYHSETSSLFCFATRHSTTNIGYGTNRKTCGTFPVGEFFVKQNKNSYQAYTIGSNAINVSGSFSSQSFSCNYNMHLFGINAAGKASSGRFFGKLYSCKIYDNGVLVRDYVPAKNPSGVAGLYDKVNSKFYSSVSGTNFIAGDEVNLAGETIAVQTTATGSYKIPYGTEYSISASKISGFETPAIITRNASEASFVANIEYKKISVRDLSLFDVYGNPINRSTANCYVVREPGQYKFPLVYGNAIKNGKVNTAAFTNNGGAYSHDFVNFLGYLIESPYIEYDATPILLNSDTDGVIANISLIEESDCKYIQFDVLSVPSVGANAIISYDENGWSNWSWHIWLWPHDLSPVEITNATGVKYNIMPVNLASKYDSDGVHIKNWFYQWGRKDPMLCPASYNSAADHSPGYIYTDSRAGALTDGIKFPERFYYRSSSPYNWFGTKSYYNLWDAACTGTGNSDNDTVKTVYDPCPVGWKFPNGNAFTGLSILSNANGIVKMRRYSGDTVGVDFPLSGCRNFSNGSLGRVGSYGVVWLSSASSQRSAYSLSFDSSYVNPQYGDSRAGGFSVRPVQDDLTKIDEL